MIAATILSCCRELDAPGKGPIRFFPQLSRRVVTAPKRERPADFRRRAAHQTPAMTYSRAGSTTIGPGCLTAVFGKGTGVAIRVWSPGVSWYTRVAVRVASG